MPKDTGTMRPSITKLDNGEYHVELDWRPGKTGHFTKHELMRLAIALLRVADPKALYSLYHVRRGAARRDFVQSSEPLALSGLLNSWLARCTAAQFELNKADDIPSEGK